MSKPKQFRKVIKLNKEKLNRDVSIIWSMFTTFILGAIFTAGVAATELNKDAFFVVLGSVVIIAVILHTISYFQFREVYWEEVK